MRTRWLVALLFAASIAGCVPVLRVSDGSSDGATDGLDARSDVTLPDGGACPAGRSNCNGVCVDPLTDSANCGACGVFCTGGPHGQPACNGGTCGVTCETGYGDCDHNTATGCEADLHGDVNHCGTCTTVCAGATNAAPVCASGTCNIACRTGYGDCNGNTGDGCEARLDTATTCGSCGNACPATTPLCLVSAGEAMCVASCATGLTVCGTSCANLPTDVNHCGACGTVCPAPTNGAATCAAGTCGVACDTGFHLCGALCVSDTSVASCGGACAPCATPANAMPTCSGAHCGFACNSGYGDCDANAANGCEANLLGDATHCGTCSSACSFAHAAATCTGGACALGACTSGYGDCDSNPANGCETNLNASAGNCGACGRACTGAGAVCVAGTCGGTTCAAGTGDCDGNATNGCEANLNGDPSNCGACHNACSFTNAAATCSAGACTLGACTSGFGNCDGNASNGCETSVGADPSNCGACGRTCSFAHAAASCSAGACVLGACAVGYGDCDGNPANGCEVDLTSTAAHCGSCATACTAPNGIAGCSASACTVNGCSAGYGNCNTLASDGCETPLNTTSNCGSCGSVCGTLGTTAVACTAGVCSHTCAINREDCDGSAGNGCETLLTSPLHCGSCTDVCPATAHFCCYGLSGTPGDCQNSSSCPL